MSMDMHIEYHSIGTPVSIAVGASGTVMRYWVDEGKKLGLEKIVLVGEIDPWTFSNEDYEAVLQLITELQVLQYHLLTLDDAAIYYAEHRIPHVVEALDDAIKNWAGIAWVSFG